MEEKTLKSLQEIYPKLDIEAEFRDANAWWITHHDGYMPATFLASWLQKCQQKYGSTKFGSPSKKYPPEPEGFWQWLQWRYPDADMTVTWRYMCQIHRDIIKEYERYMMKHGVFKQGSKDPILG